MRLPWKTLFIPQVTESLIVEKGIDAQIAQPLLAFVDAIRHEPNAIYLPLTPKQLMDVVFLHIVMVQKHALFLLNVKSTALKDCCLSRQCLSMNMTS